MAAETVTKDGIQVFATTTPMPIEIDGE
jgi:hypothetical protein